MFKKIFLVKVRFFGLNLNRLIINLHKNNIKANNFYCENVKTICFDLTLFELKNAKKYFKGNGFNFEIIKHFGVAWLMHKFKTNLGLFIGLFCASVLLLFSNLFVWNMQIYGLESIDKTQINNIINFKYFQSKNSFDINDLQNRLYENIDKISLCSVSVKGTTLIINIKEKTTINTESFAENENIVSNINGIVKNINVESGTAMAQVGETITIGDILILGSFQDLNSKKVLCKPKGDIIIERWVYGTSTLLFEEFVQQKTGNKIVNESLSLFNMNFGINNKQNIFENFEVETTKDFVFKNNIIPFVINKTIFYETAPVKIERQLEDYEGEYKILAEQNAKERITHDMKVLEQISFTSNIENGIIFTYGFKVEQMFNFE